MATDQTPRPVALVTGGARRVGRAIVTQLANAGFDVVFTYLNSESDARALEKELLQRGSLASGIRADLTDPANSSTAICERIETQFGRLSVLVNNASLYESSNLANATLEQSRRMWAIHVESPMLLAQRLAPLLRASVEQETVGAPILPSPGTPGEGQGGGSIGVNQSGTGGHVEGRRPPPQPSPGVPGEGEGFPVSAPAQVSRVSSGHIVNMLDLLAERPWPEYLPYCASKAGLWNLTLSLARELAPQVTVNGIAPGVVEWPPALPEVDRQNYLRRVPLRRAGTADEVATLVRFICTQAPYLTGEIIRLDGGRSIT
jgi:NAD(P)-dependent dehydrogenase (short-subunit alcohol dehydrogenase family)